MPAAKNDLCCQASLDGRFAAATLVDPGEGPLNELCAFQDAVNAAAAYAVRKQRANRSDQ